MVILMSGKGEQAPVHLAMVLIGGVLFILAALPQYFHNNLLRLDKQMYQIILNFMQDLL